jgi:hypothetical protein
MVKKTIATTPDIGSRKFVLEVSNNLNAIQVIFVPNEEWNMIEYNGNTYCENIYINIVGLTGMGSDVNDQLIFSIFNKACKKLNINDEDRPMITTCIYDMKSHTFLIDL